MIQGRDIVVVSIQPWDIEIGSNCKNIASQFAKHNRVLYVNPPLDRITSIKDRKTEKVQKRLEIVRGKRSDLVQLEHHLWNLYPSELIESINWIRSEYLFGRLNRRNARILANNIRSAMDRLGFKDIILFNDSSMFLGLYLNEMMRPNQYTYYMRDFLIKVPYWSRHGSYIEPQLMKQVDLILNNSQYLTQYSRQFNNNSFMVGQGCDLEEFDDSDNRLAIPADLAAIPGPVVGYVGSLTSLRLDIQLLEYIARERPDWKLVLVGPQDEQFKASSLHQMNNVHFLGNKRPDELPAYIKGFDVAINPQVINDITIGNYPRKIDEYLAMGKAVVATKTVAMEMFNEHVYLAKTHSDYVDMIQQAIYEDPMKRYHQRTEFAKSHTWENNVAAIYDAIHHSIENRITWN
ncbi:glycosyltransferase [Aureitalea marina]|uniref:Glycosyl transferase family 1 n=1 Tax=Aureitalea marina TaxID=930804 RepID=A0A2S7KR38_9FLAO|nr:glycosyltransferase [Aureitalea marina]PQB05086.1 glycosyl transferase family 1 [Aureitalea marina]